MSQIQVFFSETLPHWWSPSGLIQIKPAAIWLLRWEYVGLIGLCLLVAIVTLFLKIRPSLRSRIQNFAWSNVAIGLVLYFFRDQRVPYLGMDLLRFLQELGMVFWINGIVLFARKGMQKEVLAEQVQSRREKYLPGKSA